MDPYSDEVEWYEGEGPHLFAEHEPPLLLGRICRQWRSIALSTPELWTAIQLHCPYYIEKVLPALDRWLLRSGTLPLTIDLQYRVYPDTSSDGILQLLKRHSAQLQNLTLNIPPEDFFRFAEIVGPLPILKNNFFTCRQLGFYKEMINGFKIAPELRNVHFLAKFSPNNLPWEQLTTFRSDSLTLPLYLLVLSLSPKLIACQLEFRESSASLVSEPPLLHLKSLILLSFEVPSTKLLAHLTAPALVHLEGDELDVDDWTAFLTRSRCPLEQLTFAPASWTSVMYRQYLDDLPSLSELALRGAGPNIYNLMRLLHAHPRFLPSLRSLEEDYGVGDFYYSPLENGADLAELIVDTLEKRRLGDTTENARLEKVGLWTTKGLVGPARLSRRLQALVEDGMCINIKGSKSWGD
ncbi:hypothetical protein B0H19DRAFT_1058189 [Mycena capillaripes]|nr:hypothetical protein B0H19DRAFT_1058189 [Mycena capillaripes]